MYDIKGGTDWKSLKQKLHHADQEMMPQRVVAEEVGFRANEDPEDFLLTPLKVQEENHGFREEDLEQSTVKPSGELKPLRATLNTFDEKSNMPEEKEMQLLPFRKVFYKFKVFYLIQILSAV